MANHLSSLKRHRQSVKKNARNRAIKSELATQLKKARQEIKNNKATPNEGEVKKAVQALNRTASKGVLHKNTVARKISRLMKQANATA